MTPQAPVLRQRDTRNENALCRPQSGARKGAVTIFREEMVGCIGLEPMTR